MKLSLALLVAACDALVAPPAAKPTKTQLRAVAAPQDSYKITLLPGDGIGPEIAKSVRLVFETAGVPLQWEEHHFSPEYIDPETNR